MCPASSDVSALNTLIPQPNVMYRDGTKDSVYKHLDSLLLNEGALVIINVYNDDNIMSHA